MNDQSRRAFVITAVVGGGIFTACDVMAQAAAAPALSPTDPQAVALGYSPDNTKVDAKKYPQHAAGQMCSGCNFYQGKPTDATAPCQLFSGKAVPAKGWCSAYVKKAA